MVGNVGMLDVAVNTWFGADSLYIHMINAIPITAVSNVLFEPGYVQYEYPFLMKGRNSVEMAWRGYTTAIHSIINPQEAWKDAQGIVSYELDAALSKSQVLYFITQQPGYGKSPQSEASSIGAKNDKTRSTESPSTSPPGGPSPSSSSSASCDSHSRCIDAGLTGDCCPSASGMSLDCCSR